MLAAQGHAAHTPIMTVKGLKIEPVRWMTWLLALVTALIGANELVHDLTGNDMVPAGLTPYLLGAEALLALLLGAKVRSLVTPMARPRVDEDTPLLPKAMVLGEQRRDGGRATRP